MIRHLVITWLAISILGYGMVSAADVHYGEPQADQITLGDMANLPDDSHSLPAHDQCGHGCSHLLGLNFTPAKPPAGNTHSPKSAYLAAWNSLLNPPPSRPPKA